VNVHDAQQRERNTMTVTDKRAHGGGAGLRLAIDFGPLAMFFLANWFAPVPHDHKIFWATGAFMAATAVAMIVSRLRLGSISPMLFFSGAMVLVLGGLTMWFQNDTFIKIKPTIYYVMLAAILAFGLWTGRPVLQAVLGTAYPGLNPRGWAILTRNWALFFGAMAIANEAVWRSTTTDFWIGYKLWGALPATLLFAFANVPMLIKHGMGVDAAEEPPLPPQG
jgi:intracellular septation protein